MFESIYMGGMGGEGYFVFGRFPLLYSLLFFRSVLVKRWGFFFFEDQGFFFLVCRLRERGEDHAFH